MIRLHQISSIDPSTGLPIPAGSSLTADGSGGFSLSDSVLSQHTAFYTQLATDMDSVNRTSPTSAMSDALNLGLMNLSAALGQGIIDLPDIT